MTPQEFKAWFDGFTEALDGVPTVTQWDRIKARVAEIDGKPVTERIYLDRYLPALPTYPVYPYRPYWSAVGTGVSNGLGNISLCVGNSSMSAGNATADVPLSAGFNSTEAMTSLGRLEAKGVA